MAKDQASYLSLRCICCVLLLLSSLSSLVFVYWSYFSIACHTDVHFAVEENKGELNLLSFPAAWNSLEFSSKKPPKSLKIAVFVKKWPDKHRAGGLERHAMTLHRALAKRGHELHVFTSSSTGVASSENLYFHLVGSYACREAVDGHKTCQHYRFCGRQPRNRIHVFADSRCAEESSVRGVEGWKSCSPAERPIGKGKGVETVYCHQNGCSL